VVESAKVVPLRDPRTRHTLSFGAADRKYQPAAIGRRRGHAKKSETE
jgi:hypothetical protein